MHTQGTAQRALHGVFASGWRTALLAVLALVLCSQPFMCLLHCAHLELLRESSQTHAYHVLCGTWEHARGDEIVAASPDPSSVTSAGILVPAYWPGMLSTWTLVLGAYAGMIRIVGHVCRRPASFAAVPATPPPR